MKDRAASKANNKASDSTRAGVNAPGRSTLASAMRRQGARTRQLARQRHEADGQEPEPEEDATGDQHIQPAIRQL